MPLTFALAFAAFIECSNRVLKIFLHNVASSIAILSQYPSCMICTIYYLNPTTATTFSNTINGITDIVKSFRNVGIEQFCVGKFVF